MSERKYAPRSGGRTAEQRSSTRTGARRYPTQGTAALKAEAAEPLRRSEAEPLRRTGTEPLRRTGAEPLRGTGAEPLRETGVTPRLRVAPPAPISAPRAPFIAVVLTIAAVGVIGILLINTKTNENTFRISKLQDQKAALDNQQQKLENQIAGYESTGNLDVAARRLGLVKAASPAYIRLPDGRIIGVPKPGDGPTAVTAQDPAGTTSAAAEDGDAQNGVTPAGTAQNGAAQNGTAQNGTAQNGTAQNGTGQNGTAQGGTGQNGTAQGDAAQGGADPAATGTTGQNAGTQSAG
jgi:hypothetical protein